MKYYFIYYGRIALLFFIVCFLYLGLDEFLFVRTAKNNFFESLFYTYLFACLPIVVIIYFSNNAIAKWAEMLHVDYIRLTATEKIIIKWGREREKKRR